MIAMLAPVTYGWISWLVPYLPTRSLQRTDQAGGGSSSVDGRLCRALFLARSLAWPCWPAARAWSAPIQRNSLCGQADPGAAAAAVVALHEGACLTAAPQAGAQLRAKIIELIEQWKRQHVSKGATGATSAMSARAGTRAWLGSRLEARPRRRLVCARVHAGRVGDAGLQAPWSRAPRPLCPHHRPAGTRKKAAAELGSLLGLLLKDRDSLDGQQTAAKLTEEQVWAMKRAIHRRVLQLQPAPVLCAHRPRRPTAACPVRIA